MPQNTQTAGVAIEPLKEVRTVSFGQGAVEAAQIMQQYRVGCLVVTDDQGQLVGVLSERDILRWVAAASPTTFRQRVRDIMTKDVITVPPNTPICECRRLMLQNRIRHLPIVRDGKAVGMLSIRDVMPEAISQ